ncbi:EI24 domain-containing protein [Aquabacterium sp. OR-4]|uniref:EI24 domain-containing protein n=1 Tax=Aquabacterium sp. OR-4 TaxID=2978127 RepID=UPI0028CA838F|nr:EI24 domain-containing protein [Aquabacterium sp. OR-4]MDT7835130.1 EI24 domain-containing protein [Aquabacterium sp. OR-4]
MKLLLDSFWRAAAYCLHPKIIGLSLLPLGIGVALALGLGWMYWETAVAGVRATLESWLLVDAALKWVESIAGASFRSVLAPLIVVLLVAPMIVVLSVLLVAMLMGPSIVNLVAERRFAAMERKRGGGWLGSLAWSVGCTLLALLLMGLSLPLWFIPPLVLVLPPLIWGWLTYRVMSFDALAEHASRDERRQILREHRMPLMGIGVITGYLGAAPSLLWAAGAMTLIFAPLFIALSVWLYTLVFAFSALWFTHYVLAALAALRHVRDAEPAPRAAVQPLHAADDPMVIDAEAPAAAPSSSTRPPAPPSAPGPSAPPFLPPPVS